ncbi:hypothetical protein GCM10027074_60460 [Streptomyces deserti]
MVSSILPAPPHAGDPTGFAAENTGQYIPKSSGGPFGPYTRRQVLLDLRGPVPDGGVPHQGGLVKTRNGAWYYRVFVDTCPGGRVPAWPRSHGPGRGGTSSNR